MFSKRLPFFAAMVVAGSLVSALAMLSYEQGRVLPENTWLGQTNLSGLDRHQAFERIQESLQQYRDKRFVLNTGLEERSFLPSELGIEYRADQTFQTIFDRTGWFVAFLGEAHGAELSAAENRFRPHMEVEDQQFLKTLRETFYKAELGFVDARLNWHNQTWSLQPSAPGRKLGKGEEGRLITEILTAAADDRQQEIALEVQYEEVIPRFEAEELGAMLDRVKMLSGLNVAVQDGKNREPLSLSDHEDWFEIDYRNRQVELNEDYARQRLEDIAAQKDSSPGRVIVERIEEVVSEYDGETYKRAVSKGDFSRGRRIDRQKMMLALREILQKAEPTGVIKMEWQDLPPVVDSLVEGYQFPTQLSTGISSYRLGGHPNRVRNIKLSLEALQGIVLDPGEEFSFNRATGWITPAKGYTKTKVILSGVVKEGVGGGVCQTSTTLYRSVLNAGAPVTERRNHSLDVNYYHQYGHGLDATVYTDSRQDFRFVNDFPGPIIINAFTQDDHYEAYVEFYGLTDGREVQLNKIPTGNFLLKRWEWKIVWPNREELREIISQYILPKEEGEEDNSNPLEA